MSNVQLPGSNRFDSQIQIHTGNQNNDVSLDEEFQQHLTKEQCKNGVIDQVKYKKRFSEIKCIDRQYHVQDNFDVAHKYLIMYCNTNQFPALQFCGPHSRPHGARGMLKHYHLRFYPKLCNGVCENCRIPYACVACTAMLDKPWIYGIPSNKQERYKPVNKCTSLPVLGSFNNWNIIQLSHKSTCYDAFDEIH